MNSSALYLVVICLAYASAETVEKSSTETKPKREVGLSGEGGFHGPSHKYLPPISSGGYDRYGGGHHASFGDSAALDFGSLGGGHDLGYSKSPKVETFIVKTEPVHDYQNVGHSGGGLGYKYSEHSNHQSGLASGYAHQGHSAVLKVKSIAQPAEHGFSGGSHGGSGYNRFGGSHTGYGGYTKGFRSGGSRYTGHAHKQHIGFRSGYSANSLESSHGGSSYKYGGPSGYSYDIPVTSNSQESHTDGSTVYGVPGSNYVSSHYRVSEPSVEPSTPSSYAAGHKGLGHFGFVATRPQPLHTNYVESGNSHYSGHGSHGSSYGGGKSAFKASNFVGSSYAGSTSGHDNSADYDTSSFDHGVSSQYLPPTSEGYDYPSTSSLYDPPRYSQSGFAHSGPVHEPEPTYLPPHPVSTYLPPHY